MTTDTAKTEDIVHDNIQRMLPVRLTDGEITKFARSLGSLFAERDEAEKDAKRESEKHKTKLKELEDKIEKNARICQAGEEQRPVLCYTRIRGSNYETVRKDTGEIVESRSASLAELQKPLPHVPEQPAPATAPEDAELDDEQRLAAQAQKDANVEETEDGDVTTPETTDELASKRKGRRK